MFYVVYDPDENEFFITETPGDTDEILSYHVNEQEASFALSTEVARGD